MEKWVDEIKKGRWIDGWVEGQVCRWMKWKVLDGRM